VFARSYPGKQMAAAVPSKRLGYVKEIRSEYVGFLCAAAPMLPPGHRVFVLHDEDGFPACRLQDPRGGNSGRQVGTVALENRNVRSTRSRPPRLAHHFVVNRSRIFDDITKSDIGTGRGLLAYGRRKRDVGQDGERHGKDRGICLEGGAVVTTSGNPSAALVDARHSAAEMDRGTLSTALRYEKPDERAISPRDPPLPTESVAHPFVAQCKGAGAVRVGRVINPRPSS